MINGKHMKSGDLPGQATYHDSKALMILIIGFLPITGGTDCSDAHPRL